MQARWLIFFSCIVLVASCKKTSTLHSYPGHQIDPPYTPYDTAGLTAFFLYRKTINYQDPTDTGIYEAAYFPKNVNDTLKNSLRIEFNSVELLTNGVFFYGYHIASPESPIIWNVINNGVSAFVYADSGSLPLVVDHLPDTIFKTAGCIIVSDSISTDSVSIVILPNSYTNGFRKVMPSGSIFLSPEMLQQLPGENATLILSMYAHKNVDLVSRKFNFIKELMLTKTIQIQ